MRIGTVLISGLLISGCSTSGTMSYVMTEYGSPESKGTIDVSPDPATPDTYNVWIHKTKPKVMAQPNAGTAAVAGATYAATLGASSSSPPEEKFRLASERYLDQAKGPGCRLSNPKQVHEIVWEFDYDCSPPPPAPPSRRRPRS